MALGLLCVGGAALAAGEEEEIVLKSDTDYPKVASLVDGAEMQATVDQMAALGSRITGYPGCDKAAQMVEDQFRQIFRAHRLPENAVTTEEFPVVVPTVIPDDRGRAASITVNGLETFEVLPLWPNLVRLAKTPPEGISGNLVYVGTGDLRAFNGKDISQSIVMVDFNCSADWFNAPLLGAKAVLFVEPEETIRGEAEQKFLSIPVDIPRYWVPKEVADYLLGALKSLDKVTVNLKCNMKWSQTTGKNILGHVKGTDPRLGKQTVVVQAYYDSMSIAPTVAPGAENACSIAALYQLMKAVLNKPPKRSITFLATAGHFEALSGSKWFVQKRIRGGRSEARLQQMFGEVDAARREIEDAVDRVWEKEKVTKIEKTEEEITDERMRALGRIQKSLTIARKKLHALDKASYKAHRADPNRGQIYERKLTDAEKAERMRLINKIDAAEPAMRKAIDDAWVVVKDARNVSDRASLPDKQAHLEKVKAAVEAVTDTMDFSSEGVSLWFSVDLSSHNDQFGLFYKGYFYNYSENIQWKFSDIGKKAREFSDLIGQALGMDPAARFADGINAIQGKSWSTYMAGKLALDSEVATLGGIPGLGFATVNDERPWVDTPMDIPAKVQTENVATQTRFLACLLCDLIGISEPKKLYDLQLDDNFVAVRGRLVEFDPQMTTFPDEPLPGAIAVARTGTKTDMGVRAELFSIANDLVVAKDVPNPDRPPQALEAWSTAHPEAAREPGGSNAAYLAYCGSFKKECEQAFDDWVKGHPGVGPDPKTCPDAYQAYRKRYRRQYEEWKDKGGRVELIGLPNVRASGAATPVEGYMLDDGDGHVAMAPDMGVNGAEAYPIAITMDQETKPLTCVMFACRPMTIYDMVDQRFFELLREIYVYDATTDAAPYQFGYCLPLPPQQFVSAYEPVAVVFAPSGTNAKVTMGASVLGLRFVLVNPTRTDLEGSGYLIDAYPSMYATPYRVALDMWKVDDFRIKRLSQRGIENARVNTAHSQAKLALDDARTYLENRQYDKFFTAAREAWSFESRAYPDVRATADDVIKGILFYLALLLPFAFFTERLLIAASDVRWQIVGFFGIFMFVFVLIYLVHPAFKITFGPAIILLAFIILALTVVVITIIVQKFEQQMKEIKYEQTGIKTADVGRLSASGAAFSLGVANMRRRKVRTLLTCLTLVLLTFTVLSCTSVVEGVRTNRIKLPKPPPYNGILIRDKTWAPIGEPTQRVMLNEFGDKYPVAPRAWYFSSAVGQQSFVNVSRGLDTYAATAMLGLTPQEDKVTFPSRFIQKNGRWFRPGDNLVCLIPEGMAKKLNIGPEQVGTATVSVFGTSLKVIGIINSTAFKNRAKDLDGESITPVDYLLMQEQQAQQQQTKSGKMSEDELREYIHLAPDSVLFVPYAFVINAGGQLRSVAISMNEKGQVDEVRKNLDNLMQRVELNLYAGIEGSTYLCSAVGSTSFKGTSDLLIPILIAAAIVLNTMLGSVYERTREIYIYSSLGLAPTHIAALFIAEACVYAILGAIAGYLVGQAMAKLLMSMNMLTGLNLNYSSLSAVGSTTIIMLTVLLSVVYPAKRASQIAMPGIERRWTLPEPENDRIFMPLPFTVTGDQALGVNMFLREYLAAHADYSLGHFSTADIKLDTLQDEYGQGYQLGLMVWLAPYDLGVSERLFLQTVPTEEAEVYRIQAMIMRESGDESSWIRVTRNFINMLRKQYLLWRTFPVGLKGEYGQRGLKVLAGEVEEEA